MLGLVLSGSCRDQSAEKTPEKSKEDPEKSKVKIAISREAA
jgi:hypothetical protein